VVHREGAPGPVWPWRKSRRPAVEHIHDFQASPGPQKNDPEEGKSYLTWQTRI